MSPCEFLSCSNCKAPLVRHCTLLFRPFLWNPARYRASESSGLTLVGRSWPTQKHHVNLTITTISRASDRVLVARFGRKWLLNSVLETSRPINVLLVQDDITDTTWVRQALAEQNQDEPPIRLVQVSPLHSALSRLKDVDDINLILLAPAFWSR